MAKTSAQNLSSLAVVGIDIGKDVFHLVGFDADGVLVLRRKIKRLALEVEFKKLPACIVGMEACLSAHFVSRTLRKLGFEPRIIPAKYQRPPIFCKILLAFSSRSIHWRNSAHWVFVKFGSAVDLVPDIGALYGINLVDPHLKCPRVSPIPNFVSHAFGCNTLNTKTE